jgi:flagellar hook-associated protein 1 FlgK
VRELQRDNGKIDLMTPEGIFLLAGTARTIEFTPSPAMDATRAYNGGAGSLSGITVDGKDITPGGPGGQSVSSGALAGLFNVRDNTVPEQSLALDALAFDLIGRFADPSVDPTLAVGEPGLFTDAGANADVSTLAGLSGRIAINAAADPAQGGAVWRVRDGIGAVTPAAAGSDAFVRAMIAAMSDSRPTNAALQSSGNLTAAESAAHLSSLAGGARTNAIDQHSASTALSQSLYEAEKLETGVDTDRELQNLLIIEQAYAANARVLQTVDQMIRRLMEI